MQKRAPRKVSLLLERLQYEFRALNTVMEKGGKGKLEIREYQVNPDTGTGLTQAFGECCSLWHHFISFLLVP